MQRVLEFLGDQRNLARPVVPEAEADPGVAPVIVMPAAPRTDRRRYVTKRDLVKYGYTDECQACTQLASGMHNAKVPHDDRCRDRIGELMVSHREPKARRGKAKMWKSWQQLAAKAEEQHLDADVEVGRCHKTWRVEDVVGDAADAAPEQMDSFVQSKTEVFEKIEESLRPLCMVEDLNDDEITELCMLSNELNACETTAILNPSKFASCATRFGIREGFAVDLTSARANGTMRDLSPEDDRAELRRVQNREQPELLAGSPPSDDFNSLLYTCVEPQDISKLKTERIEPQMRICSQACELQMAMQKHFVHAHPKDSASWNMLEVQSLVSDPRVHSVGGPMCRWSLKARGSNEKVEFMRKQTRWITSSKEIAEVLRGDGRWKRDKRFVHMTGKLETVSEYPASLVVAMLKAIKRQMISDGAIRSGEMHFLQVQCRMKVTIPQSSKANGESMGYGLTRSC